MNNTLAHGRWIIAVGAVAQIVACFLPWYRLGGDTGMLPAQTGLGVEDGAGFLFLMAGLATLLLVALPYAAEGPLAIDQPLSYVVLLGIAIFAYCLRTFTMYEGGLLLYSGQTPPIQPLRGPGYWLAAVALVIFARGVFEVWEARKRF